MPQRKFNANLAMDNLRDICQVSHFMPPTIRPRLLRGLALERYLAVSRARADVVTELFRRCRYNVSRTPVNYLGETGVNLFVYQGCERVPNRLLFVAHHDYCAGVGAEDNGTALAVMLELARLFSGNTNIAFASFDLEEAGLIGSCLFAEKMAKEGQLDFGAVIDLECLGSGPTIVICKKMLGISNARTESDPHLIRNVQESARAAGHYLPARSYNYFMADHVPFAEHGMKTVALGSINDSWWRRSLLRIPVVLWWQFHRDGMRLDGNVAHTNFDTLESISASNLQKVGDVLVEFIERNARDA